MGQVVMVTSGKGGSGKTMTTVNLGAALAIQGKRVLLLDMNTGARNIDIALGLETNVVYDLSDILYGTCKANQALVRDRRFQCLYLISASLNQEKYEMEEEPFHALCKKFREKFDYIIIDIAAGISPEFKIAISSSDLAILVTTLEYSSLRNTTIFESFLQRNGVRNMAIIINRIEADHLSTGFFPSVNQVSDNLRSPIIGVIQEDRNIHLGQNSGIPVVCKRDSYVYKNFDKITSRIDELL